MTFSFTAAGTKDQVQQHLADAVKQHISYGNKPEEIQKVVDLATHWLDTGTYPNGVYIEATGHLDTYAGGLQLTVKALNIPPHKPDTDSE